MYFSGALPPHEDHIVCRQLYDCMMIFIFTFLIFTFQYELEVAAGLSVELLLHHQALGLTQLGQDLPRETKMGGLEKCRHYFEICCEFEDFLHSVAVCIT